MMMNVPDDLKTNDRDGLSEFDVLTADQLEPVEMGRAEKVTKGGFFWTNDLMNGLQP